MELVYKSCFAFLLLVLASFSFATEANTDPCFLSKNQSSASCAKYKYDKKYAHFRDESNIEHKVVVKRVLSKTTGKLLHANYDFEVKCHPQLNCANLSSATESVLWSFRNAIVENRFYEIVYTPCDPSTELCCDLLTCQVPLRAAAPQQNNQSDRRVDKPLQTTETITNIISNISNIAKNGADFKEEVATTSAATGDLPTFAYSEISSGSGSYTLCKLERSGECARVDGRMSILNGNGYAEFEHDQGLAHQNELSSFLYNFFVQDRGMHCSQTMTCGADNHCKIIMSCQER